ncbi:DoxX family protein [Algoriphagus sp. H41]|uniref:DoxX family protein n=1 Tax=Algoriphagus oliviformis TaxID=2811231 RepID=A0ABS3CA53_9BACT|nr:DoxX family protein [Algoriphagus oliviformis]MBN7813055.1 DoxX family protein [Algoriphagus oliviformis]
MKKNKVIFWTTTAIVSGMMLFSGFLYLTSPDLEAAFTHLGFPAYFRIELGLAKLIGALLLLIPAVPATLKLFAYFGFGLTFVSAIVAHIASGDAMSVSFAPFVFLVLLVVSYGYWGKIEEKKPVFA